MTTLWHGRVECSICYTTLGSCLCDCDSLLTAYCPNCKELALRIESRCVMRRWKNDHYAPRCVRESHDDGEHVF